MILSELDINESAFWFWFSGFFLDMSLDLWSFGLNLCGFGLGRVCIMIESGASLVFASAVFCLSLNCVCRFLFGLFVSMLLISWWFPKVYDGWVCLFSHLGQVCQF